MTKSIVISGCVKIPDGRIACVRERINNQYKVQVRRKTSAFHQFYFFEAKGLTPVDCPKAG